jgi:hypothetical protein
MAIRFPVVEGVEVNEYKAVTQPTDERDREEIREDSSRSDTLSREQAAK